jgi:DNA-binding CsgD family transcriptional regulator/tetratricopeptide (TPR) repeat protein
LDALKRHNDTSAARLAHHAEGARIAHEAAKYAQDAAAHAVTVGAHREAASHYRTALRYACDITDEARAELYEQLSYECYLTDQVEDSIAARTAALDIWRHAGSLAKVGDTLRWLSRLNWFTGRRAEATRFGAEAVATLEPLPPGRALAMAYSNCSQLAMLAHDSRGAVEWGQRAIILAESEGDNETLSHALNNQGTGRLVGGDASGWNDLERSLAIALAGNWQEHVARAYTNLSAMSVTCREYEQAERYFRDGIAYCEHHDLDSWRLYMLAWSARLKFERGDWQAAGDDLDLVLQHARASAVSRAPALILLGHLRLRRGDPDAMTPLQEARVLAGRIDELQRSAPLAVALAESAWLAGNIADVVAATREVYELARTLHDPWMTGELAVWLARANALDTTPTNIAAPFALEIKGDCSGAARAWRELGCPYECAFALSRSDSEHERREALALFEQLGARPAAQALRQRLRSEGVRGIPRGARTSTRAHPHGLTKREAQIFALLSQGLRNAAIAKRLFLSTKTVDHHVSAILTKLGVPSRTEAIAMARKGGE